MAEMLGKFEWEILDHMPPDELARWMALIKIREDARRRAEQKAKLQQATHQAARKR